MANLRAIGEKIQASIDSEAIDIETYSATESKEEEKSVALVEVKKYTQPYLDKQLAASLAAAFNAFCFTSSFPGPIKISLFLFFGSIPTAVLLNHLLPFLALESNAKDYYSLVRVERPVGSLFRKHLVDLHLTQLLQHIAYGEKTQAEKIIQHRPNLLLLSGPIVKDYAGRQIQQTAYQMAIAAGDVCMKLNNGEYQPEAKCEEMKEMIERYVIKHLGEQKGVAELERQGKMIFPDGFEEYIKQKRAEDLAAATEMFSAIGNAKAIAEAGLLSECGEALKKFKTHLEPKGIITTTTQGYHFDPQILLEAYGLYDDNFDNFGRNADSPKNLFAFQKVIGLIQRYLTACDAMVLCQGFQNREKFKRSLNFFIFSRGKNVYFPLDSDPSWSLGKNVAVTWSGKRPSHRCACGLQIGELRGAFGNLMSRKNNVAAKAYATSSASERSSHTETVTYQNQVMQVGGVLTETATDEIDVTNANLRADKIVLTTPTLNVTTVAGTSNSTSQSLSAGTNGSVSGSYRQSQSQTIGQRSSIEAVSDMTANIGTANLTGAALNSEGSANLNIGTLNVQDVKEYNHTSGISLSVNLNDLKAMTNPPPVSKQQNSFLQALPTANLGVSYTDFEAKQKSTVFANNGTDLSHTQINGDLNTANANGHEVTRNTQFDATLRVPLPNASTLPTFERNVDYIKQSIKQAFGVPLPPQPTNTINDGKREPSVRDEKKSPNSSDSKNEQTSAPKPSKHDDAGNENKSVADAAPSVSRPTSNDYGSQWAKGRTQFYTNIFTPISITQTPSTATDEEPSEKPFDDKNSTADEKFSYCPIPGKNANGVNNLTEEDLPPLIDINSYKNYTSIPRYEDINGEDVDAFASNAYFNDPVIKQNLQNLVFASSNEALALPIYDVNNSNDGKETLDKIHNGLGLGGVVTGNGEFSNVNGKFWQRENGKWY